MQTTIKVKLTHPINLLKPVQKKYQLTTSKRENFLSKRYFYAPVLLLTALLFVIAFPTTGFCWGPMSHIDLATEVLNYSQLLIPQIMELIKSFPYDFLYGNIGADIVIGKNLTDYEYHCHNWLVADQVFKSAKNDHQKAFAYGYISHLAADVIAHNYFVPNMIISRHKKRVFPHSYWEMRFDKLVEDKVLKAVEKTFKLRHKDDNELLRNTLEKTIFSFSTNKNIFNGIMFINRKKFFRNMLNGLTSDKRWKFSKHQFEMYRLYSIDAIFDVLNNGNKSIYTKFDPTGIEIIHIAMQIRKQLNRLYKHKKASEYGTDYITHHMLPEFPPNLYSNYKSVNPSNV